MITQISLVFSYPIKTCDIPCVQVHTKIGYFPWQRLCLKQFPHDLVSLSANIDDHLGVSPAVPGDGVWVGDEVCRCVGKCPTLKRKMTQILLILSYLLQTGWSFVLVSFVFLLHKIQIPFKCELFISKRKKVASIRF